MMAAHRPTRLRCVGFAIAVLLTWSALVVWAAKPDWHSPILPTRSLELPATSFHMIEGEGRQAAEGLRVESLGAHDVALQTYAPKGGFEAAQLPVLAYRFSGFVHTLELSLVFRRADQPGDVHAVSLPWPGRGVSTFDLGDVPQWSGHIVEVGFAQYPTPQSIPPNIDMDTFMLRDAQLQSASWRGALRSLLTNWTSRWPWSQRSVHSLGRDATRPSDSSLVAHVALAFALVIGWAVVLLGLRGRRLAFFAVFCVTCAWLMLDVAWQGNLSWHLEAAREAYADGGFAQRTTHVVDPTIRDAADLVKQRIGGNDVAAHVLVVSDSGYTLMRLLWHLQPMNTAVYSEVLWDGRNPIPGSYVVLFDAPRFRHSVRFAQLVAQSTIVTTGNAPNRFAGVRGNPLVLHYTGLPGSDRPYEGRP